MEGHNCEMFVVLSHWPLTPQSLQNSQDTIYQLQNKRKTLYLSYGQFISFTISFMMIIS